MAAVGIEPMVMVTGTTMVSPTLQELLKTGMVVTTLVPVPTHDAVIGGVPQEVVLKDSCDP